MVHTLQHSGRYGLSRSRRGYTLLECIVAAGMLAVTLALATQLFLWDAYERRETWRRATARQEATNQLERLATWSYEDLTTERLAMLQMTEESAAWLPGGVVHVTASDVDAPHEGKKVMVEITWNSAPDRPQPPVRLSIWRFAPGGAP